MFLTYFELKTGNIDAIKNDRNFLKKHGQDFMRAFKEEMEYAVYYAIFYSIDINKEFDRIVEKYRFNDDMENLLSDVIEPVKDANLTNYHNLLSKYKASKEDKDYVKGYCREMMDMMCSCEIHLGPPLKFTEMDEEMVKTRKELEEMLKKESNNNAEKGWDKNYLSNLFG